MSFEEFLRQEAVSPTKHEYYRGEVYDVPGDSPAHNRVVSNLRSLLAQTLQGKPCTVNHSDIMIRANDLFTYPDISVGCAPVERGTGPIAVINNPEVLIEVLSPATERFDWNVKLNQYEQVPSVKEILFLHEVAAMAVHFACSRGSMLRTCISGLESLVTLASIGCRLSLALIYEGVEFPTHPFAIETALFHGYPVPVDPKPVHYPPATRVARTHNN
jgi:Uma2 family endonuclease